MKKVFISQPMNGKSEQEIAIERAAILEAVKERYGDVELIDSFFRDFNGSALQFLGLSIQKLGEAEIAVFGSGWQDARGCRIEHLLCKEYGVEIFEIDPKTEQSEDEGAEEAPKKSRTKK